MFTIYCIVHRETQRRYIGATAQSLATRMSQHRYAARHRVTNPIHEALRVDGFVAFDVTTLETVETQEASDEAERRWIAHFRSDDRRFGFNIEAGGKKKIAAPEETKAKMRARWTPERIERHRQAVAQRAPSPEKGRRISEAKKRSWANKTPEERATIGAARKGWSPSPEVRARMSEGQKRRREAMREGRVRQLPSST